MKFFQQSRVNWNRWQPTDVVFKSNQIVKKIVPQNNVLSYTSKGDRDQKMCERTGGKLINKTNWHGQTFAYHDNDNYRGVMVQLKDLKTPFPTANIDFIDNTTRLNSVGKPIARLDVLVYLMSLHCPWEYVKNSQGNWTRKYNKDQLPINEGYRICYGGQGDNNPMGFEDLEEIAQITRAVKDFIVNIVVPYKDGTLDYGYVDSVIEEGELALV